MWEEQRGGEEGRRRGSKVLKKGVTWRLIHQTPSTHAVERQTQAETTKGEEEEEKSEKEEKVQDVESEKGEKEQEWKKQW